MKQVLVLDGHTNQALAVVRSLGRAGYSVVVAGHRRWPLAGWSRYCRDHFLIDGQDLRSFSALRAWAAGQKVHAVLPLTERSCILCNIDRKEWESSGIIVGCADQGLLDQAFDKARTLEIARQCHVPIPPTVVPGSLEECRSAIPLLGFPCVVKPRLSNAWDGRQFLRDMGCAYLNREDEVESAVLSRKQGDLWPLLQAYVPGQGKGAFALSNEGDAIAWFAHERLRDVRPSGSGSSLRRSIPLSARLREPAERLLANMRWHGPAMVEFRDDGVAPPVLMEVNGRFWNSLELAVSAGVDFPRLWMAVLEREPVLPVTTYTADLTLRWLWGDVKRLMHILSGPPKGFTGAYPTIWRGLAEVFGRQPRGTRMEMWKRDDPWPSVGEWVQGLMEIVDRP